MYLNYPKGEKNNPRGDNNYPRVDKNYPNYNEGGPTVVILDNTLIKEHKGRRDDLILYRISLLSIREKCLCLVLYLLYLQTIKTF